jgi:hypothetical protein
MEELLFHILGAIFSTLGEALLEFVFEGLFDVGLRKMIDLFDFRGVIDPPLAAFGYLAVGVVTGAISILVVPSPLFHPSRFHGISLLISPVVTGGMMALVGATLTRKGKRTMQIETFSYGFAFALGMALIRFYFAA